MSVEQVEKALRIASGAASLVSKITLLTVSLVLYLPEKHWRAIGLEGVPDVIPAGWTQLAFIILVMLVLIRIGVSIERYVIKRSGYLREKRERREHLCRALQRLSYSNMALLMHHIERGQAQVIVNRDQAHDLQYLCSEGVLRELPDTAGFHRAFAITDDAYALLLERLITR